MRCSQQAIDLATARSNFRLNYALHRLHVVANDYDPDRPRAPGGTEEAGQLIVQALACDMRSTFTWMR
jgi:hypothetical protein